MTTKIAVTRGYPSESDPRDGTRDEASARTQVYLSKTKLEFTGGYLAVYIVIVE